MGRKINAIKWAFTTKPSIGKTKTNSVNETEGNELLLVAAPIALLVILVWVFSSAWVSLACIIFWVFCLRAAAKIEGDNQQAILKRLGEVRQ